MRRESNKTHVFRNGKRTEERRSRSGFRTRDDVAYAESRIANERAAAAIMAASWPLSLSPLIFIVSRSGCILIFQQAGFIQPLVKLQGTSRPMMFRRFIANRSSLYFAR